MGGRELWFELRLRYQHKNEEVMTDSMKHFHKSTVHIKTTLIHA